MSELMLNAPGLYIVTHLGVSKQYIVAFKGKAPLLKVINFVSIEDFLSGDHQLDGMSGETGRMLDMLEEEPERFSYYRIETTTINAKVKEKKVKDAKSQLSDYKHISENLDKYINLLKGDEENAIVSICTAEEVPYETGKEIAKLIKLASR